MQGHIKMAPKDGGHVIASMIAMLVCCVYACLTIANRLRYSRDTLLHIRDTKASNFSPSD